MPASPARHLRPSLRTLLAAALAAAGACGSERAEPPPPPAAPAAEAPEFAEGNLLDPDGDLRESDQTLAWLTLPQGVRETRTEGETHIYAIDAPAASAIRYFGPRLMTDTVERPGRGAAYRRSRPPRGADDAPPIDVVILPLPGGTTQLEITVRDPSVVQRISPDELRAARESRRLAE